MLHVLSTRALLNNINQQHFKVKSYISLMNVSYLLQVYSDSPQTPKGCVTLATMLTRLIYLSCKLLKIEISQI